MSALADSDVLDTAARLFYQEAINRVGMDRIRDASGVSLKSLYRKFGSKEGLIAAYLRRRDDRWIEWMVGCINRERTPRARLLAIFDALDEWFVSDDFAGCAFIRAYAESEPGSAGQEISRLHKERLAAIVRSEALEFDPKHADEISEQLLLLIEGAMVRAHVGGELRAARFARDAADRLVEGPCP